MSVCITHSVHIRNPPTTRGLEPPTSVLQPFGRRRTARYHCAKQPLNLLIKFFGANMVDSLETKMLIGTYYCVTQLIQ